MEKSVYKEPTLIKLGRIVNETHGNMGSKVDTGGNENNPNQNQ